MPSKISGRCLCGSVSFECDQVPVFQANCHCDDCRRSGGGVHASFVFVPADGLRVNGRTQTYEHTSDAGNIMTKYFCPDCGSQMFASGSGKPERRGIRVGVIDDASWFKPMANVYSSRKLPSTPLDPEVKAFDKMPG